MLLWRIEPSAPGIHIGPTLAEDLALHLRYAPLTTVLAQIGSQQQAYVSTPGCAGCRHRRCTPDCRMHLLRRILLADHVASDLRPIPLGLSARPYTRLVLAVPGPQAQPLDADVLAPWRDARVWAVWRTVLGQQMVGAALAVGADGPEPLAALHERGWIGIIAPQPLVRQAHQPQPFRLPYGWRWTTPAHMLLPRIVADDHDTVIVTPLMPRPALPDTTMVEIPFRVRGQVMGILTVALLMQATQTLIRSMRDEPVAHEPVISPWIDGTTAPIDPSTVNRTPPNAAHAASPLLSRRVRTHRTWTPTTPIPDVAGIPVTDACVERSAGDEVTNAPDCAAVLHESIPIVEGAEYAGIVDILPQEAGAVAESHTHDHHDQSDAQLTPPPVPVSTIHWPPGPGFTASELASLLPAMVQEPRLMTGRAGQVGLALPRLRAIYGIELPDARALLCWFDQAGLLAAPANPLQPWLTPRPWRTTDLADIANALAATPLPTAADLADAFTRS